MKRERERKRVGEKGPGARKYVLGIIKQNGRKKPDMEKEKQESLKMQKTRWRRNRKEIVEGIQERRKRMFVE